jgi:hypothetical protein
MYAFRHLALRDPRSSGVRPSLGEAVYIQGIVLAVTVALTFVWAVQWERSTRPRCEDARQGYRLVAVHDLGPDLTKCYYATRNEWFAQAIRIELKRR